MRLKVLIIDDDPVILVLHKSIAVRSGLGPEPLSFHNGSAARDYLFTNSSIEEKYLLLLDIHMPIMNGWEFLDSMKSTPLWKQMKIILISSSIDARDHEKAKQYSQVIRYIEKPLRFDICPELQDIVSAHF